MTPVEAIYHALRIEKHLCEVTRQGNDVLQALEDLRALHVRENHELRLRIEALEKRPALAYLLSKVEGPLSDSQHALVEKLAEAEKEWRG